MEKNMETTLCFRVPGVLSLLKQGLSKHFTGAV